MTVEELIAKIGFKATGQNEARKFLAELEKTRLAIKRLRGESKDMKFDFRSSGAGRLTKDLQQATEAARRLRREIAATNRLTPRSPGGRVGPSYVPGRPVHDRISHGHRGDVAGGVVAGNIITDTIRGTVRTAAKPVVTYANEETAQKQLQLTAGVSAEQVAKDTEVFRKQGPSLGETPKKMLEVANAFVAAGLDYKDAIAAVTPTVKTAKAGFANVDDVAQAGIATMNNLKVTSTELQRAYDIMSASGKAGQVELKDMAGVLPELLASGEKGGYKGLSGLTDITSFLQYARKSTSTPGEAANNIKNFLDKIFAEVTTKAFQKEAGVNLEKKIKAGEKNGLNAAQVTLDEVMKFTKGDQFKSKKVFGDVQAGDFISVYLKAKGEIEKLISDVTASAPGSVEKDFAVVMETLAQKGQQLASAFDVLMGKIGEAGSGAVKGTAEIAREGLEGFSGKQVTDAEHAARLAKINAKFGLPPGFKTVPRAEFEDRFDAAPPQSPTPSFLNQDIAARIQRRKKGQPQIKLGVPSYAGSTEPTLGGAFGLSGPKSELANKATQQTTQQITNTTNNTNVGNDQRTQSASVTVNASGLEAVAAQVLASVKSGLSSLGPSIAKGNTTPTAPTLTGP